MNAYNKDNRYYVKMCQIVGEDFKDWLHHKYHNEENNTREIAEMVYGKRTNGPNILAWMKKLGVPIRTRSEAVALQWKDNKQRKEQARNNILRHCGSGTTGREKLIKTMQTEEYKEKQREAKTGDKNGMWNPDLTEEERQAYKKHGRHYEGYKDFRESVFERDGYACVKCGDDKGGNLNAHHLLSFNEYPELRTDINNGVTLCVDCHLEFHRNYGRAGFTKDDFKEFKALA